MKQAEVFSLLSLPCFRFVGEECALGRLECQENQVRFVERDRIFSISFYKIENIELRNIEEQPQLIFLTHVGLIVFYFYESTPVSHIRYIHDAILGAFIAYKEQNYTRPAWSGSLYTWNKRSVHVQVHSSKIILQKEQETYTYSKEALENWVFTKYSLILHHQNQKRTLRGSDLSLLKHLTKAVLDGSIQGLWESTGFFNLKRQYLIISETHLYILTTSWKKTSTIQIELCHIHTVHQTAKGIVFESLTNPVSMFEHSSTQNHIFHAICSTIVKQNHSEHVFLRRKGTLLRGTLIETTHHLIVETHQDTFKWDWHSLCRDDDENFHPHVLALRHEEDSIRIHLTNNHYSCSEFYNRYNLPHRRLMWSDLSYAAKIRIFTNRIVHIQVLDRIVQIVAHVERLDSCFQIHPISMFSLQETELEVHVQFHTDYGQYYFRSLLIQTNGQLFITTPDQIALTSQRHSPRYRTNKRVLFSLLTLNHETNRLSSTNDTFTARLINISEGGAGIIASMALSKSQKILLDIDDYPQQIICIVRHCTLQADDEYKIGLQFCALSNQSRKNINEMLQIFVKERH